MALTCADVTGRYFGYPVPGTYDLVGIGGGAVLALGIAMSHVVGMKINMEPLYTRPAILKRIVNAIVSILSVGTLALISWRCFKLGYDLFRRGRVSDTIQVPLYPFLYLAGIGMSIYCIVLLVEALSPAGQEDAPRRGKPVE
jgi:TRAP-type C4-dicarboxylate transport system permease small subunit